MTQIVHRGHAGVRGAAPRPASPLGPRGRITTRIGQLLPTAAAPTSRLNVRSRLTTTIVVIRSRALTIHLQALIQRRELIPHRAAAIQLRLAPTPHPAAAIAWAADLAGETGVRRGGCGGSLGGGVGGGRSRCTYRGWGGG